MGERKDWGGFRADSRGSPAPHPYIWARSIAARPGPKNAEAPNNAAAHGPYFVGAEEARVAIQFSRAR